MNALWLLVPAGMGLVWLLFAIVVYRMTCDFDSWDEP